MLAEESTRGLFIEIIDASSKTAAGFFGSLAPDVDYRATSYLPSRFLSVLHAD